MLSSDVCERLKRCYPRGEVALAGKQEDGGGRRAQLSDKVSVDFTRSLVALIAADPDVLRNVIEDS